MKQKMMNNTKKFDLCIFFSIILIIVLQLVKLGEFPGLYLDAINPDYIGVQLLYPQTLETKWQIAWPWLCQIYHGNNGIIITMLSTLITGRTSVLQYHITYGIVAAISVFFVYQILIHKRVGVSRLGGALASIVLITWPSLFTIIITQFYMCLFGSTCVLGGTIFFLNWLDDISDVKKINICYILFGIAFYSYFNFLFFLPALLIGTIVILHKNKQLLFDRMVAMLIAYLLGCGLYIVGWSQIALRTNGIDMTAPRKICLFISLYALIIMAYLSFNRKWKIRKILLVLYLITGCVWVKKVFPSISTISSALGVIENTTISQKILAVISDYSSILTGKRSELMIFGRTVTVLNSHVLLNSVIIALIAMLMEIINKKYKIVWKVPVLVIAVYLLCCIVLGTRMQPQHYVPLVFVTSIGICLCINSIFTSISDIQSSKFKSINISIVKRSTVVCMVSFLLFFNLFNTARIINEIRTTGGENLWASEMTELAVAAIDNKQEGINEIYLFTDWGFFTGFDYLTMNNIPFMTSIDENKLTQEYLDGKDIVACCWSSDDIAKFVNLYDSINDGTGIVISREWTDNNGKIEFYQIILSHDPQEVDDE